VLENVRYATLLFDITDSSKEVAQIVNWQEILTIIIPLAAFMGWIYNRIDKKFESVDKRFEQVTKQFERQFERVENRLDRIENRLDRIEGSIQSLESRVSRIEGQLIGPPAPFYPRLVEKNIQERNIEATN